MKRYRANDALAASARLDLVESRLDGVILGRLRVEDLERVAAGVRADRDQAAPAWLGLFASGKLDATFRDISPIEARERSEALALLAGLPMDARLSKLRAAVQRERSLHLVGAALAADPLFEVVTEAEAPILRREFLVRWYPGFTEALTLARQGVLDLVVEARIALGEVATAAKDIWPTGTGDARRLADAPEVLDDQVALFQAKLGNDMPVLEESVPGGSDASQAS